MIISEDEEENKTQAFKEIHAGYWPCEIIRFTGFRGSPHHSKNGRNNIILQMCGRSFVAQKNI